MNLKQANAIYVGCLVHKKFEPAPEDDFQGGWFDGTVDRVERDVIDAQGVRWDLLYHVRYEDGDVEHLTLEELEQWLVDKEAVAQRRAEVLAAAAAPEQAAGAVRDENENENPAASAQPKRRRVGGALEDATARTHNAVAAGHERRSRRDVKRRVDEDFEYQDPRAAKRVAAAGDAGAAIRARFGIRQPMQEAVAAAANMASESQEEYSVGEGGMRLTGLPGQLNRIEIVNFMCHEHFAMDFGEHVTFVSGTNGSGKSAVLQALQCCLGVRANNTGRAKTYQKLIRTGTDEAIIRVTVWNRPYKGFDAFRHSVFGDTITVERRISRNSSSSYTLKDHTGRIQGRKREDLDAMLQTLNLNAANPVTVMTQDTARNFLAGSSTKADQEKYQLYMEATSLDQISYHLQEAKGRVRQMDEKVQQIREEYDAMVEQHSQLQKSIKALEGIEGWRQEVQQLEMVLTWAYVGVQAAAVTKVEERLAALPAELAQLEAAEQELQQEHAALKQATDDKAQFLTNYKERATALAAELEGLKQQAREVHRQVRAAEAKIARLREGLKEAQEQKETLESAVREVQDDMVQATQAVVAQYQQQLDAARAADVACHEEVSGLEAAYQAASAATKAAHERRELLRSQCFAADSRLQTIQQQVQQLKEAGRSKVASFGGRPAVGLVQAIQRAKGQFSRPPIGPLGQYLSLDDSRWSTAVEAAIGGQLDAFLVHTMEDSRLLRQMINQHFQGSAWRPFVYVCSFDLPQHAIPPASQPPPEIPTIYRVLRCSDRKLAAPIFNNLVDQARIEKLALGSTVEECKAAGWGTRNVFACYAPDGSKFYSRGSTNSSIPPHPRARFARLGQSSAEQTSQLEAEATRAQQDLQQLEMAFQQAQQEVAAADAAEKEARLVLAAVKKRKWETQMQVTQLTQQPPPELLAATQADDGNATQAEIWQATQACIDLEQQLRERQAALEAAQVEQRQSVDAMQQKREAITRLNEENEAFLSTYQEELQQLHAAAERLAEVQAKSEEGRAYQAKVEGLHAELVDKVAQMEEVAAQRCSREEADEARQAVEARWRAKQDLTDDEVAALLTTDLLKKKITQLERKIAEHERQAGGSLAELQDAFVASQAKMNKEGRRFKQAISTFQLVEEALKLRIRKLRELDQTVEQLVNARFRHYMWRKGHSGMIKLDRKAQSLQLKVAIGSKGSKEAGAVKDLKQLSGGERSYTTVAFTLALGSQTEMPFRAMDEFDVFMDAVNRRVAMQNLFTFAKENPALQFIFLTPQDIAAVEDARQACQAAGHELPPGFVRVITMRPARANATRVQ